MKKWQKRLLIVLVTAAITLVAVFILLEDTSDLDAIEKDQVESIQEATSEDKFDAIGDDLEHFETTQDSL